MTEPEKVIAPINVPTKSSNRLPPGMSPLTNSIPNAVGSATAATAMNTADIPIIECMNATSSGILVISTRLAINAPSPPPTTIPPKTLTKPDSDPTDNFTISATVVTTAIAMPIIPNELPIRDVFG